MLAVIERHRILLWFWSNALDEWVPTSSVDGAAEVYGNDGRLSARLEKLFDLVRDRLTSCGSLSAAHHEHRARLEFSQQHVRKIFVGISAELVDEAGEAFLRQLVSESGGVSAGVETSVRDENVVGSQRPEWHVSPPGSGNIKRAL